MGALGLNYPLACIEKYFSFICECTVFDSLMGIFLLSTCLFEKQKYIFCHSFSSKILQSICIL